MKEPNMKYSTDYNPAVVTLFGKKEEKEAVKEPNMKFSTDYNPAKVTL